MKRVLREDIFGMSIVRTKHIRPELKQYIPTFIYISSSNSSHGSRIKFNGGSTETCDSTTAPTLKFDNEGNCTVITQKWMNKQNCPNAFDKKVIDNLQRFVKSVLPLLLLLWYRKIDEAAVVEYFIQVESFEELIKELEFPTSIQNMEDLDKYCKSNNLYSF